MKDNQKEEITPDQLMDTFHGSSMKKIILFTVVVHVVLIISTSGPYLWKLVAGADSSKLGEKERMEIAKREAMSSLREIAGKHGIKPEDLGNRFAENAPAAPKEEAVKPATDKPKETTPAEPEKPKSEIEKEINTKEAGPALPAIGDEKEDLFK
jgi:hypothetical protein